MPAGPRSLGVFLLTIFLTPSPFSFLCTVENFTLSNANVTNFVLSASAHISFFHSSSLPYPPSPWQLCPRRFHDCATDTSASISCGCTGRLSFHGDKFPEGCSSGGKRPDASTAKVLKQTRSRKRTKKKPAIVNDEVDGDVGLGGGGRPGCDWD